jgi:hypothetical protein
VEQRALLQLALAGNFKIRCRWLDDRGAADANANGWAECATRGGGVGSGAACG